MKTRFYSIIACVGLLAMSCADVQQTEEEILGKGEPEADRPAATLIEAFAGFDKEQKQANALINDFTFDLLGGVNSIVKPDKNIVFSPVTETINLVMMAHASDDRFRTKVAGMFPETDFATLSDVASSLSLALPNKSNGAFVTLASSVWVDGHLSVDQQYSAMMDELFGAKVGSLDFGNPASADVLNTWCYEKTNGVIREIINAEMLSQMAATWLSSLYFEGQWQSKFDRSLTREADFSTPGGVVKVPMMHQDDLEDGFYSKCDGFEMARFRFNKYANFTIVLPPADMPLDEATAALDESLFNRMSQHGDAMCVLNLDMPRFEYSNLIEFTKVYASMGLSMESFAMPAFGLRQSPGLSTVQKASIKLDEDGATAAAVSAGWIVLAPGEGFTPAVYDFVVDRPFFFFITNAYSGSFIFAGRVVNP